MDNKKWIIVIVILLAANGFVLSQDFGIKFSGFVKTDLIYDSRQTVAVREGHFLLYPAAKAPDSQGNDINARPNMNILAIQTRLKGTITGPDAFGAKTSGVIEGAFFGQSDSDINGFRLRHAFLKLDWGHNSLMTGQYWHPMFVTDVFPGTISFNTGAPFQPFSRNPQIRFTHTQGKMSVFAAVVEQRDFVSKGPDGASSKYLRDAGIPNLHVQVQYKDKNSVLGAGVDWKSLLPRLQYFQNKADDTVSGLSFIAFSKLSTSSVTWKTEVVYGENLTDMLMLGGYAAESTPNYQEKATYIPTRIYSAWTDISAGKTTELGLFAGYTHNRGADKDIFTSWGNGLNIDTIYRVSPRVVWKSGTTHLAAELEYTAAAYGVMDSKGVVNDAEYVNNLRLLLAAYYFF